MGEGGKGGRDGQRKTITLANIEARHREQEQVKEKIEIQIE